MKFIGGRVKALYKQLQDELDKYSSGSTLTLYNSEQDALLRNNPVLSMPLERGGGEVRVGKGMGGYLGPDAVAAIEKEGCDTAILTVGLYGDLKLSIPHIYEDSTFNISGIGFTLPDIGESE
jgi:hypothetical protein